ncbi:unnamed protein product, partial [Larinioides sclopetarius]
DNPLRPLPATPLIQIRLNQSRDSALAASALQHQSLVSVVFSFVAPNFCVARNFPKSFMRNFFINWESAPRSWAICFLVSGKTGTVQIK